MAAGDVDGESEGSQTEYVEHPLVTPDLLEDRGYQRRLAAVARETHALVCLPTGLGKTAVSLLVTAHRLHEVGGRALLLAPTKPLVEQHAAFYREALEVPDDEVVVFTGEVRPDDRAALWGTARVVVATPQVVENDLVGSRISLSDVTHLTFDECHRATGDYAYNYIAERYHQDAEDPLVTGMSASPGGDKEEILRVCENLGLAEVEVMTEEDADVAAHTYETTVDWEHLELPEGIREMRDLLQDVVTDRLSTLKELGVTRKTSPDLSENELVRMQAKARELMDADDSKGYEAMSLIAELRKIRTAVTYVETQSVESLRRYFERQRNAARSSGSSKASQRFVSEPQVKEAMRLAEAYDDLHPKFRRARILLAETLGIEDGDRVIVFTESRDTAETLTDFLGEHFEVARFVGQGDREGSEGMTQTEQQETLERFRDGEFEVLVSTSVAEEGLDVPEVDLVLFYEPVPKGIRAIQRKGRTGRAREGRVVVLIADDTRDEAFFWKARNEQKRMEEELRKLKGVEPELERRLEQTALESYDAEATDAETDGDGDTTAGRAAGVDSGAGIDGANAASTDATETDADRRDDGRAAGASGGPAPPERDHDESADSGGDGGGDGGSGDGDRSDDDRSDDGASGAERSTRRHAADTGGDTQSGLDAFAGGEGEESGSAAGCGIDGETAAGAAAGDPDDGGGSSDGDRPDDGDGSSDGGADPVADSATGEGVVATADAAGDDGAAVEVVVDQRELDSHIARDLSMREGVETRLETLAVGDYVLSDRVVVERKSVEDFLDTLLGEDRSMFEQVGDAARHYARPVVVVEGEDLYGRRNVHGNAIRGALASLAVDFGASVLRTRDTDDTADLLEVLARREQDRDDRAVRVHGEKSGKTLTEQQEYVVSAIAEVGPVTARSLLEHFGSVERVMTADREALLAVDGVGEVTADRIREVVASDYTGGEGGHGSAAASDAGSGSASGPDPE